MSSLKLSSAACGNRLLNIWMHLEGEGARGGGGGYSLSLRFIWEPHIYLVWPTPGLLFVESCLKSKMLSSSACAINDVNIKKLVSSRCSWFPNQLEWMLSSSACAINVVNINTSQKLVSSRCSWFPNQLEWGRINWGVRQNPLTPDR